MTSTLSPPAAIAALVQRFDPEVTDVPGGRARIRLDDGRGQAWDALVEAGRLRLEPAPAELEPDALLTGDVGGGLEALRRRRVVVRRNLHLGVGFLAATSGAGAPGRLRFHSVRTEVGSLSVLEAGLGDPVLCLHGLGGTKASFLTTVGALAPRWRVIALDLPGFGESDKPIGAPYDARWLARSATGLLDALGIDRAHLIGNSMGGRVAIEAGLRWPERTRRIVLLSPAVAWLRDRRWASLVRLMRPELGLLQVTPRGVTEGFVRRLVPGGEQGWSAGGVDEFLRAFLTPRGRAAFYAAARNIYLDEPHGDDGFWTRLRELSPETLFVWGRQDRLVPISFMSHVEAALPAARHVELDCGHVPQLEAPRATHAAIRDFLR